MENSRIHRKYLSKSNSGGSWLCRVLVFLALGAIPGSISTTAQSFVYVTNFKSNNVSVFDTSSNTVVSTIPVGIGPVGVAITPDLAFAYLANQTVPGTG